MKKILLLMITIWSIAATALQAQATLIKDINTKGNAFSSIYANKPLVHNSKYLFFEADNGTDGTELFRTNGTEAGTVMLANLNTKGNASPDGLRVFKDEVYFSAKNDNDYAFYKTDGTTAGTIKLADIKLGFGETLQPQTDMIEYKGELYFGVSASLWKTNGTVAGTVNVKSIYSGFASPSTVKNFALLNDKLYFIARTGNWDISLMESDGTAAGTKIFADTNPTGDDNVSTLSLCNGKLFFGADHKEKSNTELFVSDGTVTGTKFLKDLNNSINFNQGSNPRYFTEVNGTTIFIGNNSLWKSDGTAAGTTILVDGLSAGIPQSEASPLISNGKLVFIPSASFSSHLWVSDGTKAGTKQLTSTFTSTSPKDLAILGAKCYFSATDIDKKRELWESDGTATGTKLMLDLAPDAKDGNVANVFNFNGTLYFIGDDSKGKGYELYKFKPTTSTKALSILTDAISVAPNPIDDIFQLTLNSTEAADIYITDTNGRIIYQQVIPQGTISLSIASDGFAKGFYTLTYQNKKGFQVQKLVKL